MDYKTKEYETENFDTIDALAENVIDAHSVPYGGEKNTGIAVIAPYEITASLVSALIQSGGYRLYYCDDMIPSCIGGSYEDDYILSIDEEDRIWIEHVTSINGYIYIDDECMLNFVHYKSYGVLQKNKERDMIVFRVSAYDDAHECKCDCHTDKHTHSSCKNVYECCENTTAGNKDTIVFSFTESADAHESVREYLDKYKKCFTNFADECKRRLK